MTIFKFIFKFHDGIRKCSTFLIEESDGAFELNKIQDGNCRRE